MIKPTPHVQTLMAMQIPLFQGLDSAEIQAAVTGLMTHVFPGGERLLNQGDEPQEMILVLQGRLKVFRTTEEGEETVLQLAGPNDCLSVSSIFYPHPTTVGLEAMEECTVLRIPRSVVMERWLKTGKLTANLLALQAAQANQMMQHLAVVTVQPAMERVAGYLLHLMLEDGKPRQTFALPYPKTEMANHLGLTPETFSRCLKKLAQHGIEINGKTVKLAEKHTLCAHCDPIHAHKCHESQQQNCRMFGL